MKITIDINENVAEDSREKIAELIFGKDFINKLNRAVDLGEDEWLKKNNYYVWIAKHSGKSK